MFMSHRLQCLWGKHPKEKQFDVPIDEVLSLSQKGVNLIKNFEGYRASAYQDSVGIWTIGYGTIKYSVTKKVRKGDKLNKIEAEAYLRADVQKFEKAVRKLVKVHLHQYQFDALVSWTYNLGATNLRKSTMLRVLNNYSYNQVPTQMKRWNKAGGKVIRGLVARREKEALVFESGLY